VGKHVENRTILICAAMMRAMKQTRMSNSYLFYLFYYYTIQASLTVHQCAVPLNTTIGSREIKKMPSILIGTLCRRETVSELCDTSGNE